MRDLFKCVPYSTPDRLNLILKQATDAAHTIGDSYLVDIPGFENCSDDFKLDLDFITKFSYQADKLKSTKFPKVDLILMPEEKFCCDNLIKIDIRFATVKMYTKEDVRHGRSYHGRCKRCKNKFYYSFISNGLSL